jgi:hypothetical protein
MRRATDQRFAVGRLAILNLRGVALKGHVHGDFRLANILVSGDTLKLCDFDWAEREVEARYPRFRNRDLRWPRGAEDNGLIRCEHDRARLDLFQRHDYKELVLALGR